MTGTRVVVWDVDRVLYPDISTSYAARGCTADYRPHLQYFIDEKQWFAQEDVVQWERLTGRKIGSVGALADMLTDFLYKAELRSAVYAGVSDQEAKSRTIEGKQALLRGMTFKDVFAIAETVPYTDGLPEAIGAIGKSGVHQVGFSDGLGPFVAYKMRQQNIEIGGIVPALVKMRDGHQVYFDKNSLGMLSNRRLELLGKTSDFKKAEAIFQYLQQHGFQLPEVATIDDSAANLATLTKIRDAGGIAVGFNVNDRRKFEEARIPVLRGDDLHPFAEIVADRRKIREFCEMWGAEA